MSISALGGGATPALQRALRDAAERAVGDELAVLDGEPQAEGAASAGAASSPARSAVRRRAAGGPARSEQPSSRLRDAIVVEVGEQSQSDQLEVAGGWITPARRGPVELKGGPQQRTFNASDIAGAEERTASAALELTVEGAPAASAAPAATAARTATQPAQTEQEPAQTAQEPEPTEDATLERLIVVLKRTGIDFRDAYQVLRQIRAGAALPPKAELRARWVAADPAAWEEKARSAAAELRQPRSSSASLAPTPSRPQQSPAQAASRPVPLERHHDSPAPSLAQRPSDADLRQTPVDDVIRDRGWHHAHDGSHGTTADGAKPTLQSVTQHTVANQAYLAGLSTAEFQRLVTVLGKNAPEWYWNLRGHGGLRGLAERPAIARLNTTRIAGTRLVAWIVAVLGMTVLWYVGLHTGIWW